MADVPHFLLLLTAREDHTWFDQLAAGNKLGPRSPAPPTGGWRRRVHAGLRRRCWQRQNRLKWPHFIPALTTRERKRNWAWLYRESESGGGLSPDAFIFPSERGKPIDAHNYLQRDVLRPTAESVGIKGITFQALRRTFATHFHRVGTVKDQQSQMRHSNAQTTMNVYTQAVSESLIEAMEEFDRKMSESF